MMASGCSSAVQVAWARPCPAVPIPLSARPGSVRLSCCFPSLPFPFPMGLRQLLSVSPNPGVSVPVSACASPRQACPPVLAFPVRVSFHAPPPASPGLGLTLPVLVLLSCDPSARSLCAHPGRFCSWVPVPLSWLVLSQVSPACPHPAPWVSRPHPCPGFWMSLACSWSLGVPCPFLSQTPNVLCLVLVLWCPIYVLVPGCPLPGCGP